MNVITTTSELADVCERLAKHPFATVDTEFHREKTYWPQLCLIQVAGPETEALIDPLVKGIDLSHFFALMTNTSVEKVFHAARQDVEIIHHLGGVIPEPLFDTQVAAMVCGFGENVGYANLVKQVTQATVDKGARYTDWTRRPLSDDQQAYALADVTHLRDIYAHLNAELETTGRRDWLIEEMATLTDPGTYLIEPEQAWKRAKPRVRTQRAMAVFMELAAWRERLAQNTDKPRGHILKDEALSDIATQQPRNLNKLGNMRSINSSFQRSNSALEVIDAIERGLERSLDDVPVPKVGSALSAADAATVELLKVLLKATAAAHRVAPKMLADAADLELIATHARADVPALKGWRRTIFGDLALQLKDGKVALALADGEIKVIATETTSGHSEA